MEAKVITSAIAPVILVSIMLLVSIVVVGQLYDSTPNITLSVTNETFTTGTEWDDNLTDSNSTFIQLANDHINNATIVVTNITTGIAYPRSDATANVNWTMNDSMCLNGTIMLSGFTDRRVEDGRGMYNDSSYNVSYSHTDRPESLYTLMPMVSNAFSLLGVGLIVLAAGVIIMILRKAMST